MQPDERENGHAHVKAMLLSATSHAIPVVAGEPGFGTWQRLIFFEMDEPKDRTITFHVFGAERPAVRTPPAWETGDVTIDRRKSGRSYRRRRDRR